MEPMEKESDGKLVPDENVSEEEQKKPLADEAGEKLDV